LRAPPDFLLERFLQFPRQLNVELPLRSGSIFGQSLRGVPTGCVQLPDQYGLLAGSSLNPGKVERPQSFLATLEADFKRAQHSQPDAQEIFVIGNCRMDIESANE